MDNVNPELDVNDAPAAAKFHDRKIVTDFWAKPIPIRQFDWSATFDGYEPGEPHGYGRTEQDAINDLLQNAEDRS